MSKLVRLKPYDKKRRFVMKTYTHAPTGRKFEEARGWYKVDDALARKLSEVKQIDSDPESPNAFDVMTEDEAKAYEIQEKKRRDARAMANDPHAEVDEVSVRSTDYTSRAAVDGDDGNHTDPGRGDMTTSDLATGAPGVPLVKSGKKKGLFR